MGDTTIDQMADAAPPTPAAPSMSGAVRTWGAVIVSFGITAGFVGAVVIVLFRTVPQGGEALANVLLGTLAAMQTQVANYWLGSSAGSAAKDVKR